MILVLSNNIDVWTSRIVEKIHFNKAKFIRINDFSDLSRISLVVRIGGRGVSFFLNGKAVRKILIRKKPSISLEGLSYSNKKYVANFYRQELNALFSFALCLGKNNKNILGCSHYNSSDINKLFVLCSAAEQGLRVPYTIVTNSTDEVLRLINVFGKVIMKPIDTCLSFYDRDEAKSYRMFTADVDLKMLEGGLYFPTLFQEKIAKRCEVRVFYFRERMFAVRIYSQNNIRTLVDMRNYDDLNPNKLTLIELPAALKTKIVNLMRSLYLVTGSIDLIESCDNEYVFLEINPYGMVGHFDDCDVDLAELVCKDLINR